MAVSFVAAETGEHSCPDLTSILHTRYSILSSSREDLLHDVAVDVGEAVVTALEAVGEAFVIEAEEMHDGRLQVVDVDLVLHAGEAHLVGLAELKAALHAAAGHHDREAVGVVVAAKDIALGRAAFAEGLCLYLCYLLCVLCFAYF